ncbi:MAG: signal peptidase II [Isosphaeraceae bacterium]
MTHPPGSSSLLQREIARHRALLVVFLVSAGVCLSFDQLGKWWAFSSWREPARISQVIPGLYAGAQARNYGGIYSLEGHGTPFLRGGLAIVGFVVLGMVFRWAIVLDRDRWCKFDAAAAGLLLAGALGNQVDRLALGYVRDYVILAIRPTDIFNTADVFMVLGALLLLGSLMIHHRTKIARA